jgi:acyl carrier protein
MFCATVLRERRVTLAHRPAPQRAEIEAEIQGFVRQWLLDDDYTGADPLVDRRLDSLALEQLLDHLEETYLILFDPEEITRPNVSSVARVADMVAARVADVTAGRKSW